jgi:hypothetical protein
LLSNLFHFVNVDCVLQYGGHADTCRVNCCCCRKFYLFTSKLTYQRENFI